ncbi:hypothetical protein J6590_047038 [Homalodisca vitripennis]|nr:hypothetical protein J6590_047038 [Homalodisca vitripennis]
MNQVVESKVCRRVDYFNFTSRGPIVAIGTLSQIPFRKIFRDSKHIPRLSEASKTNKRRSDDVKTDVSIRRWPVSRWSGIIYNVYQMFDRSGEAALMWEPDTP